MDPHAERTATVILECNWLPDDLMASVLSHFDVRTLIEKKRVCRNWNEICTHVIHSKKTRVFETNQELKKAVNQFCNNRCSTDPYDAKRIAQTYG